MANIRLDVDYQIDDGMALSFKAPCACTAVDGLIVYYPVATKTSETITSKTFTFRDAHGNDLTGIGNLFEKNAYVKAVLDVTAGKAYLQNADTNAYLEGRLSEMMPKTGGVFGSDNTANMNVIFRDGDMAGYPMRIMAANDMWYLALYNDTTFSRAILTASATESNFRGNADTATTLSETLSTLKGGTGKARTTLAFTSQVVTPDATGAFTVSGLTGTIYAVGSVGSNSASGTRHTVSFADGKSGSLTGYIVEASTGNPVTSGTYRVNIIYYTGTT